MKKETLAEFLARGGKIKKIPRGVSAFVEGERKALSFVSRPMKHGKPYTYLKKKCRCTACVVAHRAYARERWRLNNGYYERRENEAS